ncbi:MAG: hypothetical protein ACPGJS_11745 [Flammeovirgaceae bacterium]
MRRIFLSLFFITLLGLTMSCEEDQRRPPLPLTAAGPEVISLVTQAGYNTVDYPVQQIGDKVIVEGGTELSLAQLQNSRANTISPPNGQ